MGRRVRKYDSTGPASTVLFVYQQDGRLLGEYDQAGTPLREYVWLGATPLAMFTPDPAGASNPPLVYYIHADHLGAPQAVLDRTGRLRWSWMTEPFGTTVPQDNPQGLGAFAFKLRLPGQYADAESGWNYSYFRDYDPSVGRFVQSDPIGLSGGINTYSYAAGNPISNIDPYGLYCLTEGQIGAIGGAAGGGFSGVVSGLQAGNPAAAVMLGALGGTIGGIAGYAGASTAGGAAIGGAAVAGASTTDIHSGAFGGAVGGLVAYDLTSGGMRDSHAAIIGGGVGGAVGGFAQGFVSSTAAKSALGGGLGGLAGAALSSAIVEALRAGNDCGCGK